MATPLSDESAIEALAAWERHSRSRVEAARFLSIPVSTFQNRLEVAFRRHLNVPKPRYRVPWITAPSGVTNTHLALAPTSRTRVTVIPDAHDSPDLEDKSRFEWIGRHVAETGPDYLVDIGDSADLNSLSFHTGNDTAGGKLKPTFLRDLESYNQAMEALYTPIEKSGSRVVRRKTRGNHENRLWRYEDMNPEVAGMMQHAYTSVLDNYGIEESEYGDYMHIDGVAFVHIPLTKMGKPRGGDNTSNLIANKSVRDTVVGHTHNAQVRTATKDGTNERVRVFETGTALPWGMVNKYAQHLSTGWHWCIVDLIIGDGRIEGWNYIPMFELERRYK